VFSLYPNCVHSYSKLNATLPLKYENFNGGWGFAPDPTGGAYDAPPDPLVGWGGDIPSPNPSRTTPSA